MDKAEVIRVLRAELEAEYERALAAARDAKSYATDEGSKAESKYDTRSLEASYLAVGQAAKADELEMALASFVPRSFRAFEPGEEADLGALVLVAYPTGAKAAILLAPRGGGLSVELPDCQAMVVTPGAPLYAKLVGKQAGDRINDPPVEILEVR